MNDSPMTASRPVTDAPWGPLIVLSGPSASGKSTIVERVLAESRLPLRVAVSATTRPARRGERDGYHYHFWTRERFQEEVAAGAFLEWAEVHGQLYGTLRREVDPYRRKGSGVILEIDVQGAAKIRSLYADQVSIFLRAGTLAAYEERLRKRGTEDEESIRRRLARVARELACAKDYDFQVINEDLDAAVLELRRIVERQFARG